MGFGWFRMKRASPASGSFEWNGNRPVRALRLLVRLQIAALVNEDSYTNAKLMAEAVALSAPFAALSALAGLDAANLAAGGADGRRAHTGVG